MFRNSIIIDELQSSSVYILNQEEIEEVLNRCKSSIVKTARKEVKEGGKVIQVFNPNFLKYTLLTNNYAMYDIATVMKEHFPGADYWILYFSLLPADPTVYVVLRNTT